MRNNPTALHTLGFRSVPHRTQIGRWKKRFHELLEKLFNSISKLVQSTIPTELLVVDSTPLEDKKDPDAKVGFTSKGPFKGFKAHVSVNQLGLPLRAIVATGNKHDCPFLPELLVKTKKALADSGYDTKDNKKACRKIGAKALIARNPKRRRKIQNTEAIEEKTLVG